MARSDRTSPLKRRLLAVAGALGLGAAACNAIIGLDGFDKDPCAQGCTDGSSNDADVGTPDATDDGPSSDAPPPPVPIPDGAAAVSWAQWPMPEPGDAGTRSFSYQINPDKSVTDNRTGLVWLPSKTTPFSGDLSGFDFARAYCDGLGDGGTKWRLPTRIELVTLLDYSRSPALNPGFTSGLGLSGGWYWSASVVRPPTLEYFFWSVNFTTGEVSNKPPNDPRTAMCVKS
jgi:Protein of unknown function (DUF1566)